MTISWPRSVRRGLCASIGLIAAALGLLHSVSRAQTFTDAPSPKLTEPVTLAADFAQSWQEGDRQVTLLRRHCFLSQGLTYVRAEEAVVWVEEGSETRVVAYLEGNVRIDGPDGQLQKDSYLIEFKTRSTVRAKLGKRVEGTGRHDPLYLKALARREPTTAPSLESRVQQAQFLSPPDNAPINPDSPPPGLRRLSVSPRSTVPYQVEWFRRENGEQVGVIKGGVNLVIYGVRDFGVIDVLTDRMVLWTAGLETAGLDGETYQDENTPLELYLEGNVILREGPRVITAERMYYNVQESRALVLDGELQTSAEKLQGPIRMRARQFRQLAKGRFQAERAWITTSRFGKPGYRFQVSDVLLEDEELIEINPFTGSVVFDPETSQPKTRTRRMATGRNTLLFLQDVPVFYWPVLATDLENPNPGIRRLQVSNDNIFGTQVLTKWDLYELLGVDAPPENTELSLDLDYLSDRGVAGGLEFNYLGDELFGIDGRYNGFVDTWLIEDNGNDNLGAGRRNLTPEEQFRGRFLWRHRHELPDDFTLLTELSWISDRNFLEQFFENDFEQDKDQETVIYLKQQRDNWAWSVLVRQRLFDFMTTTDWLPRFDHYLLGEPLLDDWFTYFTHSSVGFGRLHAADAPEDPAEKFLLRPWEMDADVARAATRHEIDYPFSLGPFRVVPYALGELGGWTNDVFGDSAGRAYGMVGLRGSIPFWRVFPDVESPLWNVHGLAHKVVVGWDYSIAGSNIPFTDLVLLDEFDDDATERFRHRFAINTFGGMIPPTFDERFYYIRSGLPGSVTATSTELADDMQALRIGINQRLQTKRGPIDNRRIIDWMTLSLDGAWFPDEDRDNFGEPLGLLGYDYTWNIGDRTALISGGLFDTFDEAQKLWHVGLRLARNRRGTFFLRYRILEGPIGSQIVSFSYSYLMSPKWASSLVTQVDLEEDHNIGQSIVLSRIGADFIIHFSVSVDGGKDNTGVSLAIEPRFAPSLRVGKLGSSVIPRGNIMPFE